MILRQNFASFIPRFVEVVRTSSALVRLRDPSIVSPSPGLAFGFRHSSVLMANSRIALASAAMESSSTGSSKAGHSEAAAFAVAAVFGLSRFVESMSSQVESFTIVSCIQIMMCFS